MPLQDPTNPKRYLHSTATKFEFQFGYSRAVRHGSVVRVAGTAGILAFSFNSIADSIWYGKPWSVTCKLIIDGVIFGLLIAGTFGWLWPR